MLPTASDYKTFVTDKGCLTIHRSAMVEMSVDTKEEDDGRTSVSPTLIVTDLHGSRSISVRMQASCQGDGNKISDYYLSTLNSHNYASEFRRLKLSDYHIEQCQKWYKTRDDMIAWLQQVNT